MQEVRLTIRKRAFPSEGRVRLNVANLPALGINDGDHVDLVNEATQKSVTTSVIADTMVQEGQIRISAEDLEAMGLLDGGEVLVRRTPPLDEKLKKAAADAQKTISKGVESLDGAVRKTAGDVKTGAEKTAGSLKTEAKKASDSIGKAASSTADTVKKTVKKATGPKDEL